MAREREHFNIKSACWVLKCSEEELPHFHHFIGQRADKCTKYIKTTYCSTMLDSSFFSNVLFYFQYFNLYFIYLHISGKHNCLVIWNNSGRFGWKEIYSGAPLRFNLQLVLKFRTTQNMTKMILKTSYELFFISLLGHSVYNNTEHFSRSQVENLSIKGQKSISYHIESSI